MKRLRVVAAAMMVCAAGGPALGQSKGSADRLVGAAVEAMGGEARLTSIRSLRIESIGHQWALEQSERPEGPWLANYQQQTEIRDLEHRRLRRELQSRNWSFPQWSGPATLIVDATASARVADERYVPGARADLSAAEDVFALAPERLLLTARAAEDLRSAPSATLQGVPQDVLAFTWSGQPCTLYLNRWTHLPTMIEMVRDDPMGVWGEVTERRWFGYWSLERGGLWYPRQTSVEWNGLPYRDTTIMEMRIDDPMDEAAFRIPDETRRAFAAAPVAPGGLARLRLDAGKAVEIAPWIVQVPGSWNILFVRQPDGIVIIEAPISAQYTRDVLAAAAARFPGVPVKAVVSTSDAWPHIGGVREHLAQKAPLYGLDLNVPLLERLAASPHRRSPDALTGRKASAPIRAVASRTTIGTGETRIELIPVRGENGERMMMAWMPGAGVLYTSDLIQPGRTGGFFMPAMLLEAQWALEREKIEAPSRAVGMHLAPTPWQTIVEAIEAAKK